MMSSCIKTVPTSIGLACVLLFAVSTSSAVELGTAPVLNAMDEGIQMARWEAATDFSFDDDKNDDAQSTSYASGRKSVFRAAAYSALLPGAGQFYLGSRKKARYFFAAEALTWIGYISFHSYGGWKKDDYVQYGAIHADAQLEGRGDEFADYVGFYESIYDFNSAGRVTDLDRAYLEDTPENHWQWNSDDEQRTYRDLKNSSREAYRRADLMIGIAVVDRIVSVIDAIRSTTRHNRQLGSEFGAAHDRSFRFSVQPFSDRCQVKLTLMTGL